MSRIEFVKHKYRLDQTVVIKMHENGQAVGKGPLMDPATFQKFVDLDPSGNGKYLDFILYQAGGGQAVMEKVLTLWQGDSDSDPASLQAVAKEDYIECHVKGFTDALGVVHKPVSQKEAEEAWERDRLVILHETVMGDQDCCNEDGFGFFRHWPGRNGHYEKVIAAVTMWHNSREKLKAQNEKVERYLAIKAKAEADRSEEEAKFFKKMEESATPKELVELDIYRGWTPTLYSQHNAAYKDLDDVYRAIADLKRQEVKADLRHDVVYEDDTLVAIAPLTIGASMKYGNLKWCVSNRTEFERSFEQADGSSRSHWRQYSSQGPLVYVRFKKPMPEYLSEIALHVMRGSMKKISAKSGEGIKIYDLQNDNNGAGALKDIRERIKNEHANSPDNLRADDAGNCRWGGRTPGRAWNSPSEAEERLASMDKLMKAVAKWAAEFDLKRLICDCDTGESAASIVVKGDA